jgi:cardiolipin synthase
MTLLKARTGAGVYISNNRVQLVRGGKDYFETLVKLIDNARYTIHFHVYIFDEDETGNNIARHLLQAAARGVKIYLLLDGYASQKISDELIGQFAKAGIHFRWFNPVFRFRTFYFGRRLHHKIFVADAVFSLVGGVNISNRYNDLPNQPAWLDWALHTEGEVSAELQQLCASIWMNAGWPRRYKIKPLLLLPDVSFEEECLVRMRRNDWVRRKIQVTRSYLEMFARARKEIIIMSSYFLPGNIFRKAIAKAAKRGVKLIVIVAGESDVTLSKAAERYWYNWLLRINADIYEYNPSNMHAKLSMYDEEWVTIGSYNVNDLSAYASIELNMDIKNKTFAADTHKKLMEIIAKDCTKVTMEALQKKQTMLTRIYQRVSYELLRITLFIFTFYFRQKRKG